MSALIHRIGAPAAGAAMLGAGVISLDVIEGANARFAAIGGSCGNVISILAWMGWQAGAIGRLGDDAAGQCIRGAFKRAGIDMRHLSFATEVATPIVIQDFVADRSGLRRHRFSFVCPRCGTWLPRFHSPSAAQIRQAMAGPAPRCFYFDRVTGPLLRLAEWAKDGGALVVFEPSAIQNARLFDRALGACHVFKFAAERLGHAGLEAADGPALIVRTEGAAGAAARWRGRWIAHPALAAGAIVDAAGAGDWCSAGLIHALGQDGAAGFARAAEAEIVAALSLGQALARLNCAYEGARGLMQAAPDLKTLNRMLREAAKGKAPRPFENSQAPFAQAGFSRVPSGLCPRCGWPG
jgi:fructokinase